MKTISTFAIIVMLMVAGNVSAQQSHKQDTKTAQKLREGVGQQEQMRHKGAMIHNLTDEQKSKIKLLRMAHYKTIQPLRNQMAELKAKQHTLSTAEKADLKEINTNIDDITKVQNQQMKASAAHHQEVRSLLTDEQKIQFDSGTREKAKRSKMNHRMGFSGSTQPEIVALMPE